ncbi:hypothetical protein ThvES_00002910 [Thiovulum sp. ES]|nr:hypothetical protein ThvES_00002910 [Thiovulum sp. ES]
MNPFKIITAPIKFGVDVVFGQKESATENTISKVEKQQETKRPNQTKGKKMASQNKKDEKYSKFKKPEGQKDEQTYLNNKEPNENLELARVSDDLRTLKEEIKEYLKKEFVAMQKDLDQKGKLLDEVANSTDVLKEDDKNSLLKKIKNAMPKFDFWKVEVENMKKDIEKTVFDETADIKNRISQIKFPESQKMKIPNDYLKSKDFEFVLEEKLEEKLKELSTNVESIQGQTRQLQNLQSLEKTLSELPEKIGNSDAKKDSVVPKEEKAIDELEEYMRDGLAELSKISRLYISKKGDLENLQKVEQKHKKELESEIAKAEKIGMEKKNLELAKQLHESFPSKFLEVSSVFGDVVQTEFEVDQEIEVTKTNSDDLLVVLGNVEIGKTYKILKHAIKIGDEVVEKAEVDEIVKVENSETSSEKPETKVETSEEKKESRNGK